MNLVYYILASTVETFLMFFSLAVVARLVLPLFGMAVGRLYSAVTAITEPALSPVRAALSRYEIFDSMPIDYSYLVMIFALLIIRLALPSASSFL